MTTSTTPTRKTIARTNIVSTTTGWETFELGQEIGASRALCVRAVAGDDDAREVDLVRVEVAAGETGGRT